MILYALCITHDVGSDFFIFKSYEERDAELAKWVDQFWQHHLDAGIDLPDPPPENAEERVEVYFDKVWQEDFHLGDLDIPSIMPAPTFGKARWTDAEALDEMAMLFSASEWPGSSGLEDLCGIVKQTGRKITDDPTIEWGRH